jgi:hypothetical protein
MNEELGVGYHQQDTSYYCGAACAQMVLHTVGQPLLSQDDLYNDNHSHTIEPSSWSTPPDGLQWTLNNLQSTKYFALDSLDSEDAISRMLCWTIHFWKVAPIALVENGNHWVVVHGYTASAAPSSSDDLSYTISSFDINDPWPPTPTPAPPPPHGDADVCGTGGARGVATSNVAYATWQADYMTANVFGTQWLGKYVAVCDPSRPPSFGARQLPERRRRFSGERLVAADVMQEQFGPILDESGLPTHPQWSRVLHGLRPHEPVLVQRLDRPDSYYWIVPARDEKGGLRAAVRFDARFGNYQQAAAMRDPHEAPFRFAKAEEVMEHVLARRIELPNDGGRLVLRREAMCVHPCLVWRPCRQSLSPFYPFRMISFGETRLFVRIFDGAIFVALTADKGGI